jgi:hypothetical protein
MCKFASFIITKTGEFWCATDKHEDIIAEQKLDDRTSTPDFVRVEILPNEASRKELASWSFVVDQDVMPKWTFVGDSELELRSRAALTRRSESEHWFEEAIANQATSGYAGTATAGDAGTATAGYAGTATAGDRGTATAGDRGTATAGYRGTATAGYRGTATAGYAGTATAGDRGTATAGYRGTATAGDAGTATAGDRGTATAGDRGTATAGDRGTATAGDRGTATAGDAGILNLRWWDGERCRIATFYVGENGVESNVKYGVDDNGNIVRRV